METLHKKTLFITGGSRGIGLAIALRAARDGANIAIAAKTSDPHPKLPGTIFTAAAEIEQEGGKALPIQCDIRFEDQVQAAVEQTAKHFGGIDICHQQRERHQPHTHRADRHEALRSDAPDQRARDVPHLENLHPLS